MEQSITADSGVQPKKKSKLDTENSNPKSSSYVGHYFNMFKESAECKICQHQISLDDNQATSILTQHLKSVHSLTDKNLFSDDLSSIPIMCVASSDKSLCMYERVFQSFKDIGKGFWQCKQCYYTIHKRTLYPMFEHLKNIHWRKASERKSETVLFENRNGIVDHSSNDLVVNNKRTKINIKGDVTTHLTQTDSPNILNTIHANEPRMSNDMGDNRNAGRSLVSNDKLRISSFFDGKANVDSEKHYKVRISLPDGNEVEGFYLGSDCQPDINVQNENAINVVYDYMNNGVRTGSPIVLEKPSSSSSGKVQRAVEDRISGDSENDTSNSSRALLGDGLEKHSYTAKSTGNPTATSPSMTKVGGSFKGTETSFKTTDDCVIIKEENLDLEELEIQVPLQYVPGLIADINHDKNVRSSTSYEYIKTERAGKEQNVAVITLNRPKALNALCNKLMNELNDAVAKFDGDESIGAIIITGSEKAFAAGNDVKEMQDYTYAQAIKENVRVSWNSISKASKPVIAAVNGYALGGGCELAMMCDIIYAGEKARFGQSEIVFGTIPGAGGTQRLARAIGKSKAMEMMLTGNQITAVEAEKSGLISKVFPPEELLSEAIKLGERISTHSQLIVSMAKEAVNSAYETKLQEGLRLEKKIYCGTLATADRKEGMAAFIEKRAPKFKNE